MPTVQRKYTPTVSLTDRNRSTKRAWSAADYALAAYVAAETDLPYTYGRIDVPAIQLEDAGLFAKQIDQLKTIVVENAGSINYPNYFSTSAESMGVASDLRAISAILISRFRQPPPSLWARVNAGWLTWCGIGQPSGDVGYTKLRLAARLDSNIQFQTLAVPAAIKSASCDTIDWDARIATPRSRPSWKVKMRFKRVAATKPRLRDDPYV